MINLYFYVILFLWVLLCESVWSSSLCRCWCLFFFFFFSCTKFVSFIFSSMSLSFSSFDFDRRKCYDWCSATIREYPLLRVIFLLYVYLLSRCYRVSMKTAFELLRRYCTNAVPFIRSPLNRKSMNRLFRIRNSNWMETRKPIYIDENGLSFYARNKIYFIELFFYFLYKDTNFIVKSLF